MGKRADIEKILIIGSGPIVIGQACEFDYSGTQACKALKEEKYKVVLINSNPATIMTDPGMADATYIEPITPGIVEKIIARERPDALLPTLGGQTGLNVTAKLVEAGALDKHKVSLIGASYEAIRRAEDRKFFKETMENIGLDLPKSRLAYTMEEAVRAKTELGLPLIIRPSFTLGGTGGGIVFTEEEFLRIASMGLKSSMISEILIEESVIGWKEFELEVMRDRKDNVVIVCSIENLDPMGVHTGDSITVAPAQTLTDKQYQLMRDAAIDVVRAIGVDTGGSNIQFAVHPETGRMVVIEMNPRVSRSSALASKATGFPIAKIAAKLAVGYTLDELPNDITRETLACFEPMIDYCVVKIPRFDFAKFPEVKDELGISMKSVGETMAIGRNFKEALQKGLRGLEVSHWGLDNKLNALDIPDEKIKARLAISNASRIFYVKYALQKGYDIEEINRLSGIDPWFIDNIAQLVEAEKELKSYAGNKLLDPGSILMAKQLGFSDFQLGLLLGKDESCIRDMRKKAGVEATFKAVDTCAAEFEAFTPYYYSTYELEDEIRPSNSKKIMILGGGPNRIGQGIEFDYCCCQASFALRELGFETIMVNSNPETVSTDYDTSSKLYFEPLTFEDISNIVDKEKPDGVIVQLGGQTPLNLAKRLDSAGVPIIGTSVSSIDTAEDRDKFSVLLNNLGIPQPEHGFAENREEARAVAGRIGYPVLMRPSYVLGGRAMRIVYEHKSLDKFMSRAREICPGAPILIDQFLEYAVEVDVDAISDGERTFIAGIMEHVESAGIHSGDSACVIPTRTLDKETLSVIRDYTVRLSRALRVKGLLNIQFAVKDRIVYVLEANPRASRTVPFVSKATGISLARIAAQVMAGKTLAELNIKERIPEHFSVKESVFPFSRFSGVDIILGPEMRSTGEVMGVDRTFAKAFYKAQLAAGQNLPKRGQVFISVRDEDKKHIIPIAEKLYEMGFSLVATVGTAGLLNAGGIKTQSVGKLSDGDSRLLDMVTRGRIDLIINTPSGKSGQTDMRFIRAKAIAYAIPYITTIQAAQAAICGIQAIIDHDVEVFSIQDFCGRNNGSRKNN